jgi:hypothetical protein
MIGDMMDTKGTEDMYELTKDFFGYGVMIPWERVGTLIDQR